jgi:NAD+ synthase
MPLVERLVNWLQERVREAGKDGIVVGLSGGVDSATVGALAKRAMGDRMIGLLMPCHSNPEDERWARVAADRFQIPTRRVDLTPLYDGILQIFPPGSDMALANLKPRLRMITLYYFANSHNYLVAGTGNKSELMVGYFTKYGDGGVDLLPLGGLLKTQVRELAQQLGVPQDIIQRPPSAGLWEGQTDEGELGLSYEELDRILTCLEAGDTSSCDPQAVERVRQLHRASQHKRELPLIFQP